MCSICKGYDSGEISAEVAFKTMKIVLQDHPKEASHLQDLSDRIMDNEVKLGDRNSDAEEAFTARTRRRDEE